VAVVADKNYFLKEDDRVSGGSVKTGTGQKVHNFVEVRKNGDRSKAPKSFGGSRPKSAKEHADSIVGTATANLSVVNDHDRAAAMWADKNYFLKEDKTFSTQPLVDSIVVTIATGLYQWQVNGV